MRSDAAQFDLVAPATLTLVLENLAADPDCVPIAGGTELMVALGAGRLQPKKLVSLHQIKELRFIDVAPGKITLGAGTTFTDIRRHATIAADLPLLAQAASWTGSIANQNRGTLGGNLVNASPAADSPPALLVYDAELTLISLQGTRTMPYREFHLSYKKTALAPGELVHSITLPRDWKSYTGFIRKVGTRNAQAISKIALACLARLDAQNNHDDSHDDNQDGRRIERIRLAAASLRETPCRLTRTEQALTGRRLDREAIADARAALASEIQPIDDIRSTARYRATVAGNLLEEFLQALQTSEQK